MNEFGAPHPFRANRSPGGHVQHPHGRERHCLSRPSLWWAGILTGLACWLSSFLVLNAQPSLRVMEYNVENLFDCAHDEGHDDSEFLPDGSHHWDSLRYRKKLTDLARVILAAGGPVPVDLVALCEVENARVLDDLTQRTRLARLGYKYLVTESRDLRGLDVALLYLPEHFRILQADTLRIPYCPQRERPTRDVLCVSGCTVLGDTLDVVVAHFPSRRGGILLTEDYRMRVAGRIRQYADSVVDSRQHPCMVITGDFNDEPGDRSLAQVLGARAPVSREADNASRGTEATDGYVNLSAHLTASGGIAGTYKFQGKWNRLDHMIVNASLWHTGVLPASDRRRGKWKVAEDGCRILAFPFLLEREKEEWESVHPYRTYMGPFHHGGTSDHLPLLLELEPFPEPETRSGQGISSP